jgi:hypothetical protein
MGILKKGIFGNINGLVGNLITYELNGQQVVKMKAAKSNKPATLAQLNNQQQVKVLASFLKDTEVFIKTGFAALAAGTTRNYYNLAIKYNKPQSLSGYYPDVIIDYTKIVLSKGSLPPALDPAVEWVNEGLKFTWGDLSGDTWPYTEDQVMLFAYNAAKNKKFFNPNGAKRTKGWEILEIPANMRNESFEVYISFVSNDRQDVADSQYIARI